MVPILFQLGAAVLAAGCFLLARAAIRTRQAAAREAILRAERERIGREFHDVLAQGLTGIVLHADAAMRDDDPERVRGALGTVKDLARKTLLDTRHALLDLRPDGLGGGSLCDALRRMLATLTEGLAVQGELSVKGAARPLDRPGVEAHLFRIAQEAVTNALRHSRALRIEVVLSYAPDRVRLAVRDDGRGSGAYRLDELLAASSSGLRGMRERADAIGARFETGCRPGTGMEISVEVDA